MTSKKHLVSAIPPASARTTAVEIRVAARAQDEVAVRAYELFLQGGSVDGHDLEHWLTAEEELKSRKKS